MVHIKKFEKEDLISMCELLEGRDQHFRKKIGHEGKEGKGSRRLRVKGATGQGKAVERPRVGSRQGCRGGRGRRRSRSGSRTLNSLTPCPLCPHTLNPGPKQYTQPRSTKPHTPRVGPQVGSRRGCQEGGGRRRSKSGSPTH